MRTHSRAMLKFVMPVGILVLALAASMWIRSVKPEPEARQAPVSTLAVEVLRLQTTSYPVVIRTQGTVQPTLANTLVPAVAGTITHLSDAFVVGGAFSEGEILMQIDARDYEIALTQVQANLAQAEAQLQEQAALAERAVDEWKSLGRRGQPSALTLREPQLAAARANRDAAQAQVLQAELDLQRTTLQAPYQGVVLERNVDPGQFVARGAAVGRIHSIADVNVRLPLTSRQLTYLDLPDAKRASIELHATLGRQALVWRGELTRAEGVDARTQQLNVIARVADPYTQAKLPLRVGQFVQASIQGQVLEDVFVIPRSALREEREVLIVDEQQRLQRRAVNIAWSDERVAAIDEGLNDGELLIVTPLSTVTDGTPVRASIDGSVVKALN